MRVLRRARRRRLPALVGGLVRAAGVVDALRPGFIRAARVIDVPRPEVVGERHVRVPGLLDAPADELGAEDGAADGGADEARIDAPEDAGDGDAPDPRDIADRLAAIPGMIVTEGWTAVPGCRYFELRFEQPADHDRPEAGTFRQFMTLVHCSTAAPMVLVTEGYANYWLDTPMEPTVMLEANQLVVEHRFFGESVPSPPDWRLMTIRQAAADHHRIVGALRPIYGGRWISTGASKGGMTAVYHRRFHPGDIDGTVAYVAPISFGAPDERYLPFVEAGGDPECTSRLREVQHEALARRDRMVALLADAAGSTGITFEAIGGLEPAFETVVLELPFTFWQYWGSRYCGDVPGTGAGDATLFDFVDTFSGFAGASDEMLGWFLPYYFQAQTQLGYPDVARGHLADLLRTDVVSLEEGLLPAGATASYDPAPMRDIQDWVSTSGERLLFVYGEHDPWTAGAFSIDGAVDSFLFVAVDGTHAAAIGDLDPDDRAAARDALARWAEVDAKSVRRGLPTGATSRGRFGRLAGSRP
jgi:hypothetical protein